MMVYGVATAYLSSPEPLTPEQAVEAADGAYIEHSGGHWAEATEPRMVSSEVEDGSYLYVLAVDLTASIDHEDPRTSCKDGSYDSPPYTEVDENVEKDLFETASDVCDGLERGVLAQVGERMIEAHIAIYDARFDDYDE